LSESNFSERKRFNDILERLKNRHVPKKPSLVSVGANATRIHEKLLGEITKVIQKNEVSTVAIVKGGFGSGKTHLAKWVIEDLWYAFRDEEILVSSVDINKADSFNEISFQLIQKLRNNRGQKFHEMLTDIVNEVKARIGLSFFDIVKDRVSGGLISQETIAKDLARQGIDDVLAHKLARAGLGELYIGEVERLLAEKDDLIRTLLAIMSSHYKGLCIFLDEFESIETKSEKVKILEQFRIFHDSLGDIKGVFIVVLTRGAFWDSVNELCPPLYDRWNRNVIGDLGELDQPDVEDLFQKLIFVYEKAGYKVIRRTATKIKKVASEILGGLNELKLPRTFSRVIWAAIEKIKEDWLIT